MKRRIFSIILAICMMIPVICALPFTSSAASLTSGIYTYTVSSDQVIITKCSSSAGGNITIPSQIDGKTVIGIGSSAFKDCDSITSVSIPSTVKKLGVKAFYGCDSAPSPSATELRRSASIASDFVPDSRPSLFPTALLIWVRTHFTDAPD